MNRFTNCGEFNHSCLPLNQLPIDTKRIATLTGL